MKQITRFFLEGDSPALRVSYFCGILRYNTKLNFFCILADWDSMGCVITQTRDRACQTLYRAFSFLLNPEKLSRVFQKLG